jgi:hypothetical protein
MQKAVLSDPISLAPIQARSNRGDCNDPIQVGVVDANLISDHKGQVSRPPIVGANSRQSSWRIRDIQNVKKLRQVARATAAVGRITQVDRPLTRTKRAMPAGATASSLCRRAWCTFRPTCRSARGAERKRDRGDQGVLSIYTAWYGTACRRVSRAIPSRS